MPPPRVRFFQAVHCCAPFCMICWQATRVTEIVGVSGLGRDLCRRQADDGGVTADIGLEGLKLDGELVVLAAKEV